MNRLLDKYRLLPVQVKASFWFLLCSFLQKGISFITTPIFTRILTTTEYGEFSVFTSWMQILTPIITLNLYSGVYSQGVVKFEGERNEYSSSLQGLSLSLVALWSVIYLSFHDFFNNLFTLTILQMIAMFVMIWVGGSFNFWSMDQRVDYKYKKLVLISILVSVLQPTLCILLILSCDDKVTARIIGMAVVQLLCYGRTFIAQMKKGKRFYHRRFWTYALKFNIPLLPHYLSLTILSSSDRIMIRNMVGASEAGIYNLAYNISLIMTMFNTALLQTIEPWIYKKLKAGRGYDISKVAYPAFLFIVAINIFLISLAPEIVSVFAPAEYQNAIWVVPSVAMSVYFMFLYTFFATFEFYYEKTSYVTAATVGGALLNIGLNFIFIKRYGYVAAGYTTLFSYVLFAVLHYCFMRKICKIYMNDLHPYNLKFILLLSGVSTAIGFSFLFTYRYPLIRYLVVTIMMLFIFTFRKKLVDQAKALMKIRNNKGE